MGVLQRTTGHFDKTDNKTDGDTRMTDRTEPLGVEGGRWRAEHDAVVAYDSDGESYCIGLADAPKEAEDIVAAHNAIVDRLTRDPLADGLDEYGKWVASRLALSSRPTGGRG